MLTLEQLIVATNIKAIDKYKIEVLHKRQDSDDNGSHILVAGVVSGGSQPQKCSIRLYNYGISLKSKALVYCSCKMFIHTIEVALGARGSAKILNSKATVPTKTNPKLVPGLCPHLVTLAKACMMAEQAKQNNQKKAVVISSKLKKNSR
jgi:hypothetical protein